MGMPKTTMDEYHRFLCWQDNIRTARQILSMEAKSKAHPMQH
jgi:hypothetical protein